MRKLAVVLFSLLVYNSCVADELAVVSHGLSKHVVNHNFNENNYGIGLRYQRDQYGLQLGSYYNSFRKQSVYGGVDLSLYNFQSKNCLSVEAGPYIGLASGYKYPVVPMLGLQAAVRCNRVFVRVRAMPDPIYNSKGVGAVEVGLIVKKF